MPRFTAAGHGESPAPHFLRCWSRKQRNRRQRRIDRLRKVSRLPSGKTWETFEHDRMPLSLRQQLDQLANGDFTEHGINVLAFGLPGTGKTHALCAVGHRLVEAGHSVLFAPAYRLVQETARRQARPGFASAAAQTGQLRLPALGRSGLPAPGC